MPRSSLMVSRSTGACAAFAAAFSARVSLGMGAPYPKDRNSIRCRLCCHFCACQRLRSECACSFRAGMNPKILGQCMMISNEQPTLVVTCKLGAVYRQALADTISDRARIIFLDGLEQPAARRAALSSAMVLLAHNTVEELHADEIDLIKEARL